MSTRAQIAIQIGPEQWVHIYCHYDGYPEHMLPALAPWTPEDILAAKEIRQVRADALDCFDPPREPPILPRPICELCHLYVWQDEAWVDATDQARRSEGTDIAQICLRQSALQSDGCRTKTMQLTTEPPG